MSRATQRRTFQLLVYFLLHVSTAATAQVISEFPEEGLSSTDWTVRREAFANLIGLNEYPLGGIGYLPAILQSALDDEPSLADRRRLALITLLEVETEHQKELDDRRVARGLNVLPVEERLTEDYLNYHGDLVAAVSYLKDVRALPVLLGVISSGTMVHEALVSFGNVAIDPVIELLESDSEVIRTSAMSAVLRLLDKSREISESSSSLESIRLAAVKASSDSSPMVRRNSVRVLARLGDPDSIALVERISRTDPYRAEYREGSPYIVREAATEALRSLSR